MQGADDLLLQLREVETTASLRAVILSNFPAHNKVEVLDVEVDLRQGYCANSVDDLDLWASMNWGSRTHVAISCHQSGFHCPTKTLSPIPYVSRKRVNFASIGVRPTPNCASRLYIPDGQKYSRLSETLSSGFVTGFALLGYSRGAWETRKHSIDSTEKGGLTLETRDMKTVERCLKMVSVLSFNSRKTFLY